MIHRRAWSSLGLVHEDLSVKMASKLTLSLFFVLASVTAADHRLKLNKIDVHPVNEGFEGVAEPERYSGYFKLNRPVLPLFVCW